jgi:hypothetical protein
MRVDFGAALGYVRGARIDSSSEQLGTPGPKEDMMAIMGIDASSLLGSRQIAGVQVQHMGQFRRDTAMSGDVLAGGFAGEAGARIAAGRSKAVPAQTPEFKRRYVYLAVTDEELALVGYKSGSTAKPGEVLTRIARSAVASAEVGKGAAPPLKITLADGEVWQFEISNPGILALFPSLNNRKHGRRVADVLNGALTGL